MVQLQAGKHLLKRKIAAGALAGTLFSFIIAFYQPNPFGTVPSSFDLFFKEWASSLPVYMMYALPAMLLYGVMTSMISDLCAHWIASHTRAKAELILSLCFHLLFGSILLWIGLAASLVFFLTDRLLSRVQKPLTYSLAFGSLVVPAAIWLLFMSYHWVTST